MKGIVMRRFRAMLVLVVLLSVGTWGIRAATCDPDPLGEGTSCVGDNGTDGALDSNGTDGESVVNDGTHSGTFEAATNTSIGGDGGYGGDSVGSTPGDGGDGGSASASTEISDSYIVSSPYGLAQAIAMGGYGGDSGSSGSGDANGGDGGDASASLALNNVTGYYLASVQADGGDGGAGTGTGNGGEGGDATGDTTIDGGYTPLVSSIVQGGNGGCSCDGSPGNGGSASVTATVNGEALVIGIASLGGAGGSGYTDVNGADGGSSSVILTVNAPVYGGIGVAGVGGDGGDSAGIGSGGNGGDSTVTLSISSVVGGDVEALAAGGYGGIDDGDGGDDGLGILSIVLANGAVVNGMIFGNNADSDLSSLTFQLETDNEDEYNAALNDLVNANGGSGSITIKGHTYTWNGFDELINLIRLIRSGLPLDDRINGYDLAAPDALYCTVGGGVSAWEIDLQGKGTFSFAITAEDIQAAFTLAVSSGVDQVIGADGLGNTFYAISDGKAITFTAPELREPAKTYQFTFDKSVCAAA